MNAVQTRLRDYALLMRLDKPIGIWLLMWPTLWGLWMAAGGPPDRAVPLIFVAGVVLMRSAGCVINDFADRKIDPHVTRTAQRPLAAGRVSGPEALGLFAVLSLGAFALVLQTNGLTIALSVPAVLLAASYPFAKRFHHMPQAHLGAAFAWAIPMGFAAQTGAVPAIAFGLFLVAVLWTVAYDTFYAMADRDEDLKIGVKSSAILFGQHDRLITAALQLNVLIGLALIGQAQGYGAWFAAGVLLAGALVAWQQWLIRSRDPDACFQAFLNNHAFGATVFAGLLLETWPA